MNNMVEYLQSVTLTATVYWYKTKSMMSD